MTRSPHWGAQVLVDAGVHFSVWAPDHAQLRVHLVDTNTDLAMRPTEGGWHELITDKARQGSTYWFVLPDGSQIADPAARHQPGGVAGPSQVIDLDRYRWTTTDWPGRPWHEAVIYELHVGTFTPEGTFTAAKQKLPHLKALGVTAIELMPIGSFPGQRNWGYDGVLPYAPAAVYGHPEDLQALIDAAHELELMVFLDVVYNHLGPEGNPIPQLAPAFYTNQHQTPWGAGFRFEGEDAVRSFFIQNAVHWLHSYRLDGLRLDAVHAICDDSHPSLIEELAKTVHGAFGHRHVHLIVENEHNQAGLLERREDAALFFNAQWNDDVHHALHVAITGETSGYYADYANHPAQLARAIAEGFAFQGDYMSYRRGPRGEPSGHLPPQAFISFIQNHDQIGNRAFGDRISGLAPVAALKAATAIYLLLPQIPMIFMGEEWWSTSPFQFFCDFQGELGRAVTQGRRAEFSRFPEFADPATREMIPDPLSVTTFEDSKLDWHNLTLPSHGEVLRWYRDIVAVRHRDIVPLIPSIKKGGISAALPSGAFQVRWQLVNGFLDLHANLSAITVCAGERPSGRTLWEEGEWCGDRLGPWGVHWSIGVAA